MDEAAKDEALPSNHLAASIVKLSLEIIQRQSSAFGAIDLIHDQSGRKFNVNQVLPSAYISFADLRIQVSTLIAIIGSMKNLQPSDLLPPTHVSNVTARLSEMRDLMDQLINYNNAASTNGALSIDIESWTMVTLDGGSYNYGNTLLAIAGKVGELSDQFGNLQNFVSVAVNFGGAIKLAEKEASKIAAIYEKIRRHSENIDRQKSKNEDYVTVIESHHARSIKLTEEIESEKRSAQNHLAEILARSAEIRADTERALNLRSTVESYQGEFDKFRSNLKEREENMRSQEESADELLERLHHSEADIIRITESADAMLKSATVAGLASVYGDTRDKISDELHSARRAFYFGILFLGISVLPLAGFLFPELGERIRLPHSSPPSDPKLYALQIAARLVILVPAAWFLRFAANRHAALFRLREEYGHRYALASSVEGFKKQAEAFKEEIATATYAHLTANPASTLTIPSKSGDGDPPHPLMKAIMDSVTGKLRDQKPS